MADIKVFEVGGRIRDSFLDMVNKDVDYVVETDSFDTMREYILSKGGKIFLESLEHNTIRAWLNDSVADYVFCTNLYENLWNRDFTMNAMAIDTEDGHLVDLFGGRQSIYTRIIHCVRNAKATMKIDPIRLLRAIRFSITKSMGIDGEIVDLFSDRFYIDLLADVSKERIREELHKMFSANTLLTLNFFSDYPMLARACFSSTGIWLEPTLKEAR